MNQISGISMLLAATLMLLPAASAQQAESGQAAAAPAPSEQAMDSQFERDRQVVEPEGSEEDAISRVQRAGLMGGYPDGNFHPERTLSRAELAIIMAKTFRLSDRHAPPNGTVSLKDVPPGYWAAQDIYTVVSRGVMVGYRAGYFYPEQRVSRVEALAILAQAFGVHQFEASAVDAILSNYPDSSQVPDWARKAVATSLKYGFVDVPPASQIRPLQPMTRGDMAYALNQYLNRLHGTEKPKAN